MLNQERLNELFEYINGKLYWKISRGSNAQAGHRAGCFGVNGYRKIRIDGSTYYEHRLIYLMLRGALPKFLDHIDNDRSNNRIENLRPCTVSENQHNSKTPCTSSSGIKGVSVHGKRWRAMLTIGGKLTHIGMFDDIVDAEEAVRSARELHHGDFARHA